MCIIFTLAAAAGKNFSGFYTTGTRSRLEHSAYVMFFFLFFIMLVRPNAVGGPNGGRKQTQRCRTRSVIIKLLLKELARL